jgi:hypothetical protein
VLTHEEALLICREFYRRGYARAFLYGCDRLGYHVRARRHLPGTAEGLNEDLVLIDSAEDMGRWVRCNA